MHDSVPVAWQADQCLHAFYYNKVGDSSGRPYEDFHKRNRADPNAATVAAIEWWMDRPSAPSDEDTNLYQKAPTVRRLLSRDSILHLDEQALAQVCASTHATWDHLTKMSLRVFGIPNQEYMSAEDRVPTYARWLMQQKNERGWSILQLLHFVLYEGDEKELWERLYLAARDHEHVIAHYGLNSIAEVVGWTRPDLCPPRNGRTSKALRALGYDVVVY